MEYILQKGKYLIAYIDIQGTKDFILNDNDENIKKINSIIETLSTQLRFKRGNERYGSDIPILHTIGFGDSIEFSIEIEYIPKKINKNKFENEILNKIDKQEIKDFIMKSYKTDNPENIDLFYNYILKDNINIEDIKNIFEILNPIINLEQYNKDTFNKNLKHLLTICKNIQYSLLKSGILSRGGITYDEHNLYKEENITYFFSKAHVKACELESKKAKFPLILIHEELLKETKKDLIDEFLLERDSDNYFVHYLKNITFEDMLDISNVINKNLFENYNKNNDLYEKYQWLNLYLKMSYSKSINNIDMIKLKQTASVP